MSRRSSDLIISEILEICMEGAYKTNIIYKANLNFLKANKYLESMKEQGLISHMNKGSKILYKTTQKGKEVNTRFKKIQEEMWNVSPQ